jgi:hypothetical protein
MPYRKIAAEFAESAVAFCAWCEAPPAGPSDTASLEVRLLLARLYLSALSLPGVEWPDSPDGERPSDEQRKSIWPKLATLPISLYNVFFTPSQLTDTPCVGDLTDDLQDIYCDLKQGLWLFDQGHHQAAVWQWHFSFETHWAHHATDALHALQAHASTAA